MNFDEFDESFFFNPMEQKLTSHCGIAASVDYVAFCQIRKCRVKLKETLVMVNFKKSSKK